MEVHENLTIRKNSITAMKVQAIFLLVKFFILLKETFKSNEVNLSWLVLPMTIEVT